MAEEKDQTAQNSRRRDSIFLYSLLPIARDPGPLLAGLLALFVILPLLRPGLPGTADTPIHFYRAMEFARSWGPGVVYPRWAPDLAYGYGYPLWNFAPPLPYFVPLAFRAVGLSLEAGIKGLVILTALGYALGAYLFVRDSLGPRAGLVAAAVYTLAPFALREVLLYGGNYPQYLAIGLFPWLLWALGRVITQRGGWLNILLTALFYGLVILSHLFHALLVTPVAASYAGLLWLSSRRDLRGLAASALGLGLGLLWTAFFWLPALIERRYSRAVEAAYVSVSPFFLRFLSWSELLAWPQALDTRAANPWVPLSLGPAALLLAGLGTLALMARRRGGQTTNEPTRALGAKLRSWCIPMRQGGIGMPLSTFRTRNHLALFFLALLAACVFMVLPVSNWLWANVPFLAVAEFPWRWLGLANLSLAFLAGASVYWFSGSRQTMLALGGLLAILLASAVYLYPPGAFVHYGESAADITAYELATQTAGTTTVGEYLPRWVPTIPSTSPLAEALVRGDPVQRLDPASLPDGTTASLRNQTAVGEDYALEGSGPFQARFFTFYFPGWTAFVDGQPVEILIEPDSGLVSVPVPAGSHELRLRFRDTPLRLASNAVTALTLLGLAVVSLRSILHRERKEKRPDVWTSQGISVFPVPLHPRTALLMGGILVGLLLLKVLVVDPHTGWFRRESPPGQVSGVQHPLRVNLDDRFWLLGYDLNRDRVPQGGALRLTLYWQAQRPIATNYRSFVHLDAPGDQRTWAGSDNFHPGDATAQAELPTSTWDTARYVRDEHVLPVPPGVPPVAFDLRVGLYDPDTGQRLPVAGGPDAGNTVRLQVIQVTPGRGLRPRDVPNPVSFRLGDHIQLLGYEWGPGDPSGTLLTLYWQASAPIEVDYVVFVHLLDENGGLAWGADGPPLGGLYPASAWRPGSVVTDPRTLALGELPPGAYTLSIGMYRPDSLARLPVTDEDGQPVAGDAIPLARLTWP
jgi:hypothetical protein